MPVEKDAIAESLEVSQTGSSKDAHESLEASFNEDLAPTAPPPSHSFSASPGSRPSSAQGLASPPLSKPIGTKTLFGVGLAGMSFPGLAKAVDSTRATPPARPPVAATSVPDFLNEVTRALNAQATEARAWALEPRARGAAADRPSAQSNGSPPALAATAKISSWVEAAEFEDPDDGPTSLTPGIISISEDVPEGPIYLSAPTERAKEGGREREGGQSLAPEPPLRMEPEEAVVLGPSQPSAFRASELWSKDDPTPADPISSVQRPMAAGGLSLSAPGYPRPNTPTSSPSSLPAPSLLSADGKRRTLHPGNQAPAIEGADGAVAAAHHEHPSPYGHGDHLRLDSAEFAPLSALPAIAVRSEGYSRAPTGEVHLLKSYIKLAIPTLAGLIAATFIGGLAVGILVGRGRNESVPSGGAAVSTIAPVAPAHSVAPGIVKIVPTPVVTTVVAPTGASAAPVAAAPHAASDIERDRNGEGKGNVEGKEQERGTPSRPTPTSSSTSPPPAAATHAPSPRAARVAPIVAPMPRAKAPEIVAESPPTRSKTHSPSSAGTTARTNSARRTEAAVPAPAPAPQRPAAPTMARSKSSGSAKPSTKSGQGKPGWRDPFAE